MPLFARPSLLRTVVVAALVAGGLLGIRLSGDANAAQPRLVVVGDVHGDIDGLVNILGRTGLIDGQRRWKGGTATLVQTGDYFDRGPAVREVLDLFMSLERGAAAAGGKVIVLLGNHEAMNLIGDLRDVSPETYASFADQQSGKRRESAYQAYEALAKSRSQGAAPSAPPVEWLDKDGWLAAHPEGYLEYREALGAKGLYGKWLRERPAVAKVQDVLLVHGGLNPEFVQKSIDGINEQVRDELARFDRVQRLLVDRRLAVDSLGLTELVEAAHSEVLLAEACLKDQDDERCRPTLDGAELNQALDLVRIGTWYILNENGPLWYRGYAKWTNEDAKTQLAPLLERYGAARIVVGHTTLASSRITPRFSNRVFLIDTGMLASVYKGRASALEFRDGRASAIYVDDEPIRFDP